MYQGVPSTEYRDVRGFKDRVVRKNYFLSIDSPGGPQAGREFGRKRSSGGSQPGQPHTCRDTAYRRTAPSPPETKSSCASGKEPHPGETISRRARRENVTRVTSLVTKVTWRRSAPIRAHGPGLFFSSTCLAAPALRKLPLTEQLLGAGAHGKTEQLGEVGGTVNVERDSGKIGVVEHH